ncbi:hypothetical protein, partial [Mesorhizobium sp.]|uniref:hypothetical protein n=1 Tax=Mesorhizobium sp. TaxID=1871066 RepID=UPI0025E38E61
IQFSWYENSSSHRTSQIGDFDIMPRCAAAAEQIGDSRLLALGGTTGSPMNGGRFEVAAGDRHAYSAATPYGMFRRP